MFKIQVYMEKKKTKQELTWKDIQDILLLDEAIMLERFSKTGRIRAFSQRHCREVLRKLKKEREGEK